MEVCATDLFWYLVEEKGQVVPSSGPAQYTKTVAMQEEEWERFKTVKNTTGRMASDYTLSPSPAESDLDSMSEPYIEPACHKQVGPSLLRRCTCKNTTLHHTHILTYFLSLSLSLSRARARARALSLSLSLSLFLSSPPPTLSLSL